MAAATVMAFSQIQAGRQAVKTAQYNAQLYEIDAVNAENEAVITQQKANLELSRFRQNIRSITGDTKVLNETKEEIVSLKENNKLLQIKIKNLNGYHCFGHHIILCGFNWKSCLWI